jgi:addiction module RelB/DinJ family antitoxin
MTTKTALVRAGISPSEAINVFYRRIVSDKGIPFSLNVPNAETRKAIENIRSRNNLQTFKTHKEFSNYLRTL